MNDTTAKVTILFHGDPSVGIFPYSYEMTIPRLALEDWREENRELIRRLYTQLDQEGIPQIIFDDEQLD
jgi:hypothetical protein